MDPHQDVWSRFTGGDGAPYWTLQACGINPRHITATQAAILHNEYPEPANPEPAKLPAMIWGTNYARAASQTLFTLFFAGRDFAPKCIIDGVNIQDYLQSRYIAAVAHLAMRLRDAGGLLDECVIGWDSLNEPFEGLCGVEDITVVPKHQQLKKGSTPTPFQSMRLAMGEAQTCEYWDFGSFGPRRNGSVTIDPEGVRLWVDPDLADEDENGVSVRWGWKRDPGWQLGICIWALHGVWDLQSGECLRPDYFAHLPHAREVIFLADYWRPHWRRYTESLRRVHPEHIPFVQPTVFAQPPPLDDDDLKGRCCFSTHYYDGLTLMTRHWNWFNADALGVLRGKYASPVLAVKVGEKAIRASIREQLGVLRTDCLTILGAYPTMIGEIGTPMDMDHKYSYGTSPEVGLKGKGDYSRQTKALDASLQAADGTNALNYTIWTYAPDSSHVWGEGWNLEDLSLWSTDDLKGRRGGRRVPYLLHKPEKGQGKDDAGTTMMVHEVNPSSATLIAEPEQEQDDENIHLRASESTIQLHRLLLPPRNISTAGLIDPTNIHTPTHEFSTSDTATSTGFPAFNSPATAFCFLTNGARAYRAFTRAYPLATVGLPSKWEFDVAEAEFSMTVRVGREDASYLPQEYDPEAAAGEAEFPTEIFVPLVQFASDKVVKEAFGVDIHAGVRAAAEEGIAIGTSVAGSSASTIPPLEDGEEDHSVKSSRASVVDEPPTPPDVFKDALALDVTVSAGRTEVSGQVLRWFYPIPPARSPVTHKDPSEMTPQEVKESEGDGRVEYTITISRKGGAIDFPKLGIKGMALGENESGDDEGWVQRCCGSSCVVM
jgi:hypothetical protein